MEKLKYYPVYDKKPCCYELVEKYSQRLSSVLTDDINQSDIILVFGWDWFMLDSIKKYNEYWKAFVWVNWWTLGFLMNESNIIENLPSSMEQYDFVEEKLINVKIQKMEGDTIQRKAINDIVLWNNILDYFDININGEDIKKDIKWTGLLISTAIWSTSYWLNLSWPLIPLKSDLWGVMWIASLPFKYQIIKPQDVEIFLKGRSSANVWIDWYGGKIDNIQNVKILPGDSYAKIWFVKPSNLESKRFQIVQEKI